MRARTAGVAVALVCCAGVGRFAAAAGTGGPDALAADGPLPSQVGCNVGGAPTHPYGERPPEQFLRYRTRPVVIGCAELASGRRFELVGYQLGRGGRGSLCIDHHDLESGVIWGCGSDQVWGGGAIDATATDRTPGRVPVVAGTVRPSVAEIAVRSELDGRLRRHPAALVAVRDEELLRRIGVRRAFGRYLAEVPSGARAASAEGLGPRGRTLGLAFFPGFRGPVGDGRACYTQPRVIHLRLIDPARVGRRNRLRIVAVYPRGRIASIDVTIGGRGRVHADLAPGRGRRVVTLPVAFSRRGRVVLDVTAEGLPLSADCRRGPLRRSAPRSLGVRVR